MAGDDKPLGERIEVPSIPKDAQRQIELLEREFVRAELDQLRKSIPSMRPLYQKRNALISSKEVQDTDFWPRVFSHAPAEIDEYILPSDSGILGECLRNLTVERFEVDDQGNGEPRSLRFIFEFATGDENPYFENAKIVKDFYYRYQVTKTAKGKRRTWEGLVSEPVRINWKEGMDPTKGLLDAACDLFEAEKKNKGVDRTKLPEYEALVKKLEEVEAENVTNDEDEEADDDDHPEAGQSPVGLSFFAWFGYRGRDVTAEQSEAARKEDEERYQKLLKGEAVDDGAENDDDDEDEDDEEDSLEAAEIFADGEELATSLAEDLWPSALKYYVESFETMIDLDDLDDEDMEDVGEDDDEEEEAKGKKKEDSNERPRKKART